ncbi:Manganese transporter SMF1 [Sparassis crispa]|uniref:Manganese transporter SMF1 n=1 Tax=Sparassis crispa TaxID=139825 RepID=A0A401G5Y9_9APHY|nr:Manganese transporter SMF1 [Sparassis crispa]GBE77581.1 Manganese transporter SMF1 [Sparassis crispa]
MARSTSSKTKSAKAGVIHRILFRCYSAAGIVLRHARKHTGVGMICSVAYFDPGNWGADLQAGSEYGYKLLFVVLLSGLFAIYMQILASRLGCVTGLDLASHCRLLLHDRPKHTRLWRWLVLYPLYLLSEAAIISTDLAELLGSAIALCLLFPKLPEWAGVLVTAADVLALLAFRDPLRGQPVRVFELLIAVLVFTVLICMAVIISKAGVHWGHAFDGFIPSHVLITPGGLYTSVSILGATVMPHSLYLGSALATQDRLLKSKGNDTLILAETRKCELSMTSLRLWRPQLWAFVKSLREHFVVAPMQDDATTPKSHEERENHALAFVRAHLYHGIVDMVISLLGLAVVINTLILVLASAVFYSPGSVNSNSPATLFDTYDLLRDRLGKAVAILFALALLASGQSSSIVATLAGQTVSEGFIRWRMSPVARRLVTRCLGLIPSMVVASALGRAGISTLLIVSQVVLSIVLPFVAFPLIWLTSSKSIMSVKKPRPDKSSVEIPALSSDDAPDEVQLKEACVEVEEDKEAAEEEMVDFSNGKFTICLGYSIWLLIVIANAYTIVTLAMGEDG